jgi:hypothetical protein
VRTGFTDSPAAFVYNLSLKKSFTPIIHMKS